MDKTIEMETLLAEFQKLVNGSTDQFQGVQGTQHVQRNLFWDNFRNVFPERITIQIDEMTLELDAIWSASRRSTAYKCDLSIDQYKKLNGTSLGLRKKNNPPYLVIYNGVITLLSGGKYSTKLSNSRVTSIR